jgi:hypothetical protein
MAPLPKFVLTRLTRLADVQLYPMESTGHAKNYHHEIIEYTCNRGADSRRSAGGNA